MANLVTTMPTLVFVLYYRVSTEEQHKHGYSLPEQQRECRERVERICRERGAKPEIYEFEDTVSGGVLERPGLEALRKFCRSNRVDYMICLDPDRFARDLSDQLLVAKELDELGVQLEFVSQTYPKTPEGKLFFSVRGAISEFEKAKIRERTLRGRRGKLAAGGIPNYISTYGYSWDKEAKTIRPDPETAKWVKQIFVWYADGRSYQWISDKLNSLGVRPPRADWWHKTTIARIIRNSTYMGRLVLNKWDCTGNTAMKSLPKEKRTRPLSDRPKPKEEWVTVQVEPIISEELWEAAQAMNSKRTRHMKRGVGLLSGLCVCGLCGGKVHYMGDPKYRYLRCSNRYPHLLDETTRPRKACEWQDIRSNIIEQYIWRRVVSWIKDPALLEKERQRQAEEQLTKPDTTAQQVEMLEVELKSRREEQQRIYRLFTKGIAPPTAEDDLERLARQIRNLEDEIERLRSSLVKRENIMPAVKELSTLAKEVDEYLSLLELKDKQKIVRLLISEVQVWPDGRYELVLR
ncbi:recombinase family protein [Symbiobacterium terraclitae]|uniref:recombinase family protein n=1 Tax=Symbiobacterium terraclitae TaxID=557451 RepID=UPI0035B55FBA